MDAPRSEEEELESSHQSYSERVLASALNAGSTTDAPRSEGELRLRFRDLTWPPKHVAIHSHSRKHRPVRATLFTVLGEQPLITDLGILERFPHEIRFNIARSFDLKTALKFSHANRAARDLINGCNEYRLVAQVALEFVWALMRTDLAQCTTAIVLRSALGRQECVSCGGFGGLVFLPTMERVCLTCLRTQSLFKVYHFETVHEWLSDRGVKIPEEGVFGTFFCPPGFHDDFRVPKKSRTEFAEANGLRGFDELDDESINEDFEPEDLEPLDGAGDEELSIPAVELEFADANQEMTTHLHLEDVDHAEPEPAVERLLASCILPCYDPTTEVAVRGRTCKGCWLAYENNKTVAKFLARDRVYLIDGFWTHAQTCRETQMLLDSCEGMAEDEGLTSEEESEDELSTLGEVIEEKRFSDSEYVTAEER
ncbi:unnamed protein product [Clonostachys byssicola]|uniref:F-box domain-containing protein n=1 Tax=Clonostachys byssicola TaxID=160290 RepID=A0A9N9UGZ4_9HYPO|nr:unnamed protein product [Clonostachys byssicola]